MILLTAFVWESNVPRWSTQLHPHCEMTQYVTLVSTALHENQTCCCLEFGKRWIIPFQNLSSWNGCFIHTASVKDSSKLSRFGICPMIPWEMVMIWDLLYPFDFSIKFIDTSDAKVHGLKCANAGPFFLGKNWYMMFTSPTLKGEDC